MTSQDKKYAKQPALLLLANNTSVNKAVTNDAQSAPQGLDKAAREVLDYIHSQPAAHQYEPHIVRQYRQNPFEHQALENINKEDIYIDSDTHTLQVRIYRPTRQESKSSAALVYFHGGGFVLGDIESYDKMLSQLCFQSDIVIFSVAYRLAPETVFPGAIEDVDCAMKWLYHQADSLNINPLQIAIGGDSAGANLATVYCILNQNTPNYLPCLQLLIYPSILGNQTSASRELFSENLLLTKPLIEWFHNHYITQEEENDPRFNVMKFDDVSNSPPAFILTCGFDPLRDEGQMYANKLQAHGVEVKHVCYSDMFHGFINFGTLIQSQDAVTECANVLKGALKPQENCPSISN